MKYRNKKWGFQSKACVVILPCRFLGCGSNPFLFHLCKFLGDMLFDNLILKMYIFVCYFSGHRIFKLFLISIFECLGFDTVIFRHRLGFRAILCILLAMIFREIGLVIQATPQSRDNFQRIIDHDIIMFILWTSILYRLCPFLSSSYPYLLSVIFCYTSCHLFV